MANFKIKAFLQTFIFSQKQIQNAQIFSRSDEYQFRISKNLQVLTLQINLLNEFHIKYKAIVSKAISWKFRYGLERIFDREYDFFSRVQSHKSGIFHRRLFK